MKRQMTVGRRIGLGFLIVIVIAVAIGGLGVWSMRSATTESTKLAEEFVPEVTVATNLRGAANRVMYQMRGYGMTAEKAYYDAATEELAALDTHLEEARVLAANAVYLKALKGEVEDATNAVGAYKKLVEETVAANASIEAHRKALDEAAAAYMEHASALLARQREMMQAELAAAGTSARDNDEASAETGGSAQLERLQKITLVSDVIDLTNATRIACFKSQALRDPTLIQKAEKNFDTMNQKLAALRKITRFQQDIDYISGVEEYAGRYQQAMNELLGDSLVLQDLGKRRDEAGRRVIKACAATTDAGLSQTDAIATTAATSLSRNSSIMMLGLGIGTVIAVACAVWITRSITRPLTRIINSLNDGADQVSDAAQQVSSASQQLAQGASEQASSLEETSASLQEMAAMTRTSAENARQANDLSSNAREAAHTGDRTMTQLNQAMSAINESSGKISKIIKVIEEIAFQTNLLALNAAVEAARAGEHGKGFAVVAEEVRNLAQRCAGAAGETTGLIEDSVVRAKEGADVAGEVGKSLSAIVGDVAQVTELITGIARASEEQAQGVEQVNTAVGELDKVTQQNASGAEESASAAEQLSAQAATVKQMVDELASLIGGASRNGRIEQTPCPTL